MPVAVLYWNQRPVPAGRQGRRPIQRVGATPTKEPLLQFLENIRAWQVEIFEARAHDLMRQWLSGPPPCEREKGDPKNAGMSEGCAGKHMRAVFRIQAFGAEQGIKNEGASGDVYENKG